MKSVQFRPRKDGERKIENRFSHIVLDIFSGGYVNNV